MNRAQRVVAAQETLAVIEQGFFIAPSGQKVWIDEQVRNAIVQSGLYAPEDKIQLPEIWPQENTTVEVTPETTLEATQRLYAAGIEDIYCLNFASANNPGGGFLGGSQAQEESLARSSALYPCLMQHQQMYEFNRLRKTMLYSDYMIYAPAVPVFRDDEGCFLEKVYPVSFITAPAVNMGALLRNTPHALSQAGEVLRHRLERILQIALQHGHSSLILGAWGCGVFANQAHDIAQLFKTFLGPYGSYSQVFKHIVYAVYDTAADRNTYSAFKQLLSPSV